LLLPLGSTTDTAFYTSMTTSLVAHAGRIVLIGWNKRLVEIDTVTLMPKEIDVRRSRNSDHAFPGALRLLAAGIIDTDNLNHAPLRPARNRIGTAVA